MPAFPLPESVAPSLRLSVSASAANLNSSAMLLGQHLFHPEKPPTVGSVGLYRLHRVLVHVAISSSPRPNRSCLGRKRAARSDRFQSQEPWRFWAETRLFPVSQPPAYSPSLTSQARLHKAGPQTRDTRTSPYQLPLRNLPCFCFGLYSPSSASLSMRQLPAITVFTGGS